MISANVPTLAGGASNEASVLKGARIQQIVMQNRLPTVTLTQTVRKKKKSTVKLAIFF